HLQYIPARYELSPSPRIYPARTHRVRSDWIERVHTYPVQDAQVKRPPPSRRADPYTRRTHSLLRGTWTGPGRVLSSLTDTYISSWLSGSPNA
ncbi:hypothetical protein BDZ97DRAFT_1819175, partial [Flammula alnicola]